VGGGVVTTPLRPCGRERCRLCNPQPIHDEPRDTLPMLLLSAAMLVAVCILAFVLLPVLVL
jgi:hypothetical protein